MDEMRAFYLDEGCFLAEKKQKTRQDIFNIIIYEDEQKVLFYNLPEKRIFKIQTGEGFKEIEFQEAIREIDIIPRKKPEWKRLQILKLAKDLGFFGIN